VPFSSGANFCQPGPAEPSCCRGERLPLLNEIGIQTVINGAIPVSADGEPIMGLAPEYENLYVACGFTAGIAASGGAGEAMANWIVDGDPGMDLWQFDVRRFGSYHMSGRYLPSAASTATGAITRSTIRSIASRCARRRSPPSSAQGWNAVFRVSAGSAQLVRPAGTEAIDKPSFEPPSTGPPGRNEAARGTCCADRPEFSKTRSDPVPSRPCSASPPTTSTDRGADHTQLCNERGGIEADSPSPGSTRTASTW
jgi:4-methylaminobutanoate oxidase (formaldehyde-forming)